MSDKITGSRNIFLQNNNMTIKLSEMSVISSSIYLNAKYFTVILVEIMMKSMLKVSFKYKEF